MYTDADRDKTTGRFVKGKKGGPGKPPGSVAIYRERFEGDMPAIINKLIEMATGGDIHAIKIILDRVYPISQAKIEELETRIAKLNEQLEAYEQSRAA